MGLRGRCALLRGSHLPRGSGSRPLHGSGSGSRPLRGLPLYGSSRASNVVPQSNNRHTRAARNIFDAVFQLLLGQISQRREQPLQLRGQLALAGFVINLFATRTGVSLTA